jgi:Ring finger domain
MSSFTAFLDQIANTPFADSTLNTEAHNNPHAIPTPIDVSALYRLVQDQMQTLFSTAPSDGNRRFLEDLITSLEADIDNPPEKVVGVRQEFLDGLDRVSKKSLKKDDACPICAERFLDDPYCLVVELPCHKSHRFDLECVSPWLQSKGTCPMCRKDMTAKKKAPAPVNDDDEEGDGDMLYA